MVTIKTSVHDFLIVGIHPDYPLKRTLVKFEDIPHTCKSIQWAKMYLYFWYSHKASFMSDNEVLYIPRPLQVNQIKNYWNENTAMRDNSQLGVKWNTSYLGLDGSDAVAGTLDVVTVYTGRQQGPMEFDITQAAKNWLSGYTFCMHWEKLPVNHECKCSLNPVNGELESIMHTS